MNKSYTFDDLYTIKVHSSENGVLTVFVEPEFDGQIGVVEGAAVRYIRLAHGGDSFEIDPQLHTDLEVGEFTIGLTVDYDGDLEVHVGHDVFEHGVLPVREHDDGSPELSLEYITPVDYTVYIENLPEGRVEAIGAALAKYANRHKGVDCAGSTSRTWTFNTRGQAYNYLEGAAHVLHNLDVEPDHIEIGVESSVVPEAADGNL